MNMKEVLCMFVTTHIKSHSFSYDILNANMTLFEKNEKETKKAPGQSLRAKVGDSEPW